MSKQRRSPGAAASVAAARAEADRAATAPPVRGHRPPSAAHAVVAAGRLWQHRPGTRQRERLGVLGILVLLVLLTVFVLTRLARSPSVRRWSCTIAAPVYLFLDRRTWSPAGPAAATSTAGSSSRAVIAVSDRRRA